MEPEQKPITMQDVMALLAQMNEQNQNNLVEAIAEMKKPTAEQQAKMDADALKLKQQQDARYKLAKAEEDRKKMQQEFCPHSSYNAATGIQKHAFRAQVHTPNGEKPYFRPMCIQCNWIGPKILATPDMLTQGVNLDTYAGLNVERILQWAKLTPAEEAIA